MKVQIIENEGRHEWAVVPYADFERMRKRLEDLKKISLPFDRAKRELAAAEDELIPAALVERLASGEHPIRVWREYRGMTEQALADSAGVGKSAISQLESGTTAGALGTLRALTAALRADVDDLEPWSESAEDDSPCEPRAGA